MFSEEEYNKEELVFEAVSDQVNPTKIIGPVMFVDDSEIKPINVAMFSDVSGSLFLQETVDNNIEAAILLRMSSKQLIAASKKHQQIVHPRIRQPKA